MISYLPTTQTYFNTYFYRSWNRYFYNIAMAKLEFLLGNLKKNIVEADISEN